jgi:hypothetical protein
MPIAIEALLSILALSSAVSWWWTGRKTQEKPVRLMIFIGYFWLLTFIQIGLAVLAYMTWQHFISR